MVRYVAKMGGGTVSFVFLSVCYCYRSNEKGDCGFIDMRRINVAFTRARERLYIIVNQRTVEKHAVLGRFMSNYLSLMK